jgi:hypothetical protein
LQELVLVFDPSTQLVVIMMASEGSQSSTSFDILTPTVSISEPLGKSAMAEPINKSAYEDFDDLTLGRELMLRRVEVLRKGSACCSDKQEKLIYDQELLPDETGEYVKYQSVHNVFNELLQPSRIGDLPDQHWQRVGGLESSP